MVHAYNHEFINGFKNLKEAHKGCVASIGSFDGVHLGHQFVLEQLKQKALELNLPTLVMLFEPQPNEFFAQKQAPARLMRLREKVETLMALGIHRVLCLHFNEALRALTAHQFITQVLVDGIHVQHLVIGDDFRFGCNRDGDFELLKKQSQIYGYTVSDSNTQQHSSERISSTRIRQLLENDELDKAALLLGRTYSISGRVIYGKQLGRTIGFPTANVNLVRRQAPVKGVYAVRLSFADRCINGVANVGIKPTVGGVMKPLLEVHCFDFSGNLYGIYVKVEFLKKIRNEKKFSSVIQLSEQIKKDLHIAKDFFTQ